MTSPCSPDAHSGNDTYVAPLSAGQQVHRWTLVEPAPSLLSPSGKARARWLCRCVCGTEKPVLAQSLRLALRSAIGGSRSCGCLQLEQSTRHGNNRQGRPTAEYMAWMAAKKRCNNSANASYARYGGRGISMCERWNASFAAFIADMGLKPDPSFSLDRIDPEGNYEPGNCRWAPVQVQSRNKTNSRWYELYGRPVLMGDIAAFFGITRDQARRLVAKNKLPVRPLAVRPRVPDRWQPIYLDLNPAGPQQAPCALAWEG